MPDDIILRGPTIAVTALLERPRFYNALSTDCMTAIRMHTMHVNPWASPWDRRILANGYLGKLMYERGIVDTKLPFAELKARCLINPKAKAAD